MIFFMRVFSLLLCSFSVILGTEIVLKSGKSYSGEIISESGTHITLRNEKKKITIKKSAIAKKDGEIFQTVLPLPRTADVKPLPPEESAAKKKEKPKNTESIKPWVVTLKNGTVFRGPRISENERILVLESKGSPVSIFKSVIASIDSGNGGKVASVPRENKTTEKKPPVIPVQTEKKNRVVTESKNTEGVTELKERADQADAADLTTIIVPKPRPTSPKTAPHTVPENSSDMEPETLQKVKTEKKIITSVKKNAASKKTNTSLSAIMTVDVVSGDRPETGDSKVSPQSDVTVSVASQQKLTVLPQPKPRTSISSTNEAQEQTEKKIESTATTTETHAETAASRVPKKNVRTVENKPRKEVSETANMVEIPAPQKKDTIRKKQQKSTVERKPHPAAAQKNIAEKTAATEKSGGGTAAPAVAAPAVPVVTVVAPLGTSDEKASAKKKRKKKTHSKIKKDTGTASSQTTSSVATEKTVLPQAPQPSPKVSRKRTDGKRVIVMNNGTEFIGTVSSENARCIMFNSDGAKVTIFKHLIKEIDGEPYVQVEKATPSRFAPKLTQGKINSGKTKHSIVQKRRRQDAFRVLPAVVLPETADPGQLAQLIANGKAWKDRSVAVRNLGAMGQWATGEISTVTALLADTAEGTAAAPLWIDTTNEKELLAPGLEAARALAQMGEEGETALVKSLQSRNPMIRRNAVFGLGYCFKAETSDKVIEALGDSDPLVRQAALGSLPPKKAFQYLKKALEDPDPGVRNGAVVLLGKIRNEAMIAELLPLGKSHHAGIRAAIAKLLGLIGSDEGMPVLKKLSDDADTDVRIAAVKALGMFKDSSVVPLLIDKLSDKNPGIRADAVEALGNFHDSRSIPALYSAVKDGNSIVREKAQLALKKHTEIPLLIESLDDESAFVRSNAAYILWLMTGTDNGEDKEKWEKWAAAKKTKTSK